MLNREDVRGGRRLPSRVRARRRRARHRGRAEPAGLPERVRGRARGLGRDRRAADRTGSDRSRRSRRRRPTSRRVRARGPRRLPAIPGARDPRRRCPRRQPAARAGAAHGLGDAARSSNVVDATNYTMLELGQPLHGFDMDLLAGPGIVVRRASEGERLTTLDDVERVLSDEDLLICDLEKPVAIAGVMGGASSEVSDETTDVLLESAYFTRDGRPADRAGGSTCTARPRTASSAAPIPEGLERAATRCAKLIVEWAGGTVAPRGRRRRRAADPTVGLDAARAGVDAARRTTVTADDARRGVRPPRDGAPRPTTTRSRSRCPATASTSSARST